MHFVVPSDAPQDRGELIVRDVLAGPEPGKELAPAHMRPRGHRGEVWIRGGVTRRLGFLVEAYAFLLEELCHLQIDPPPVAPLNPEVGRGYDES